jgi:hypothetical protein
LGAKAGRSHDIPGSEENCKTGTRLASGVKKQVREKRVKGGSVELWKEGGQGRVEQGLDFICLITSSRILIQSEYL